MLNPKALIVAIFLITFLNVIFAETEEIKDCYKPCHVNDTTQICVLDNDDVCFRVLPSKCVKERIQCIFQRDYTIYIDMYCEIEAFLCQAKPIFQSPPESSEHAHTYSENPEDNIEVIFKEDYENGDFENIKDLHEKASIVEAAVLMNSVESSDENSVENI